MGDDKIGNCGEYRNTNVTLILCTVFPGAWSGASQLMRHALPFNGRARVGMG